MTIQILPARLANQIAAGEVVERPASVVKELVENSIDAGATRIDVDIEKGGSKLIRIRDNGSGINKDELELALSRHATSKITCLDDLEAIISLGFRGEALASISSVSRLTLTSRTQQQTEAWSAYAEGRDMAVQVKPAAHPVGTTVEVVDLFFNTPARRKFLRTDKTEFSHIDELLKRIALSRFDVAITLRHNGTMVRQYRAATNDAQRERRLAAACGSQFVKTAVEVSLEHQGLTLRGWICTPQGARAQNDIQHCFVNQRMMKDKLINHAIRQGYEASLRSDQFAAYVLYIDIDPHQVDVNVHPAKHEVRFHQARLVHDFIYQAVADALMQVAAEQAHDAQYSHPEAGEYETATDSTQLDSPAHRSASTSSISMPTKTISSTAEPRGFASSRSVEGTSPSSDSSAYSKAEANVDSRYPGQSEGTEWRAQSDTTSKTNTHRGETKARFGEAAPSYSEQRAYKALMTTPVVPTQHEVAEPPKAFSKTPISVGHVDKGLGKALAIVSSKYLLLQRIDGFALLDLDAAAYLSILGQMRFASSEGLKAQPLLIPQALPASAQEIKLLAQYDALLQQFGIVIRKKSSSQIMVMAVCQPLRKHNLQHFVPALLDVLAQKGEQDVLSEEQLMDWLAVQATQKTDDYGLSQAITLITELEHCWQDQLAAHFSTLLRPVDVATAIEAFKHD
ncbi:DNA mismatch repair protein MutL [Enterovibrio norvegicus FF-33]|uniref:DNA mismatch repair protein MutL n=1 Tax=Enterovibrio norvegicus FF-454 TaxID=1185651 RepID=A0A1E5C4Y4_9GAMM|nr:DNA mismatch repair endonuclease MutL [Enterovibrio norvegicus]OEE60568.1 DNA mismatch repair protein MutL [Enterovibrio norvegicus FF-454]OEE71045.1 DNA mismatch repair protein MutL [Enterovibrio norvegicus FF-33]OEE87680.1 DNA mismatch repair protein MutL [Enterovibrio norvegicus FF-162]